MDETNSAMKMKISHILSFDVTESSLNAVTQIANDRKDTSRRSVSMWTPEEDRNLLIALRNSKREDWTLIAESTPGRTGKQCWHRFQYHLKDQFRTGDWTPQEDAIILQQQAIIGNRWSLIASLLPGRSENSVKNRWHCSLRYRRQPVGASATEDTELDGRRVRRRRARAAKCEPSRASGSAADAERDDLREDETPSTPNSGAAPAEQEGRARRGGGVTKGAEGGFRLGGPGRSRVYETPRSPGRHTRHSLLLRGLLFRSPPPEAAARRRPCDD